MLSVRAQCGLQNEVRRMGFQSMLKQALQSENDQLPDQLRRLYAEMECSLSGQRVDRTEQHEC